MIKKNKNGIDKYNIVESVDVVEYLKDPSERISVKNEIKKIIFLFLSYLKLLLGVIIKKQLKIVIIGINIGLKNLLNNSWFISGKIDSLHSKESGWIFE